MLDTNIVVAAMRSPAGASAALLRAARSGDPQLLANVALALEYEAICGLEEHRRAAGLDEAQVETFLTAAIAMAEPVESHFLWRPQLRDPADEFVLEAAVNGQADAIVTFNVRDFGIASARFGVGVWKPIEALRRLES